MLRELLQNAADASASKVVVKFETIPSSTIPVPQQATPSALAKHTILHHTLKSLVVTNNGAPFGSNDWSRLKRIAEGNPDETKIGAFGVGFYSVFSDCEEPFVSSGNEAMAFYWKGNQLFTRRLQLTEAQSGSDTTFVLNYRNTTSSVPALLPLCQFLTSSLTFVGLSSIELWMDDWKLMSLGKLTAPGLNVSIPKNLETKTQDGLMNVTSIVHETAQLDAKWLNIVGWKPKTLNKAVGAGQARGGQPSQSLRTFFSRFSSHAGNSAAANISAREEREAQEAISDDFMGESKTTIFLHVDTATITTNINKSFGFELERATKKPAPKTTKIAVLTASYDLNEASQNAGSLASKATDVFASVLPSKSGRIFIGFPTHQTTGLSAHISAQSVIPTVERESIDLNARWVRTWNMEMLRAAGIVCRVAWHREISSVKEKLSKALAKEGRVKVRNEDIETVLPEAIHILNQFTFRESTPSSQVGSLVEEAFWTCTKTESIEILSSRGILPSHKVRMATDELSFVDGIPIVPKALFDKASGFVKRLVDYGIITDVTTADIKKELEAQALSAKQVVEFLQWLSQKARIQEIDHAVVASLLQVTVANDDEDGKVLLLGQMKHFINSNKIPPSMPVPLNTMPFKFTKQIDKLSLELLGWEDLQIVPWARFLIEGTGQGMLSHNQDIQKSVEFASQVLPVISKQWDGLSHGSKSTIISLFSPRTTVPTKFGMKKPSDAYFPSVKLFDDLPIVTVNSVKEKLLVALGVRKTIELNLVFDRLLKVDKLEVTQPAWSHVDLIRYLASVRNDIPKGDIKRLQNTPICIAEGISASQRHKVSDLFEPKDELRALGLNILQWPGVYRAGNDEGKFLKSLGLKSHPTVVELIDIISAANVKMDPSLRDRALRYLVDFHFQHNYSTSEIANSKIPFLPLQGKEKGSSTPGRCFTNESNAFMGFDILRSDLNPHAAKLGVQPNPPIAECAAWLVKNPPESHRSARQIFDYFATRLNELSGPSLEMLSHASIVPVLSKSPLNPEKPRSPKHLTPNLCFLGNGRKYADIFEYVDFGMTANSFLIRCGAKHEPSTVELATLVVREPARVFSTFDSAQKYLELLTTLAAAWSSLKKDKSLVREMKASAFLLASTEFAASSKAKQRQTIHNDEGDFEDEEDMTIRSYQLAHPDRITIVDDVVNYSLFKGNVLAAPMEEELEAFYSALGAIPLSANVEEKPRIGSQIRDQMSAIKLKKLVQERIKLFFHDVPKEQIKRDAAWLEKNLAFVAVTSIQVHKSLRGQAVSHVQERTAINMNHAQLGMTIFFKPGSPDLFNVSQSLILVCLYRPKPQQAIILTTLLEMDLNKLRARGYDVSRILRRRENEARIAEEARRKHLEEEQQRIKEADATRKMQSRIAAEEQQQYSSMPGFFPDSLDHHKPIAHVADPKGHRGLFSTIAKAFGGESGRRPSQQSTILPDFPSVSEPEPSSQALTKTPTQKPHTPVANPENLHNNLLNAIKASRAHNSSSVVNNPAVNDVQETQTFCDAKPGQNISVFAESASGIKIFLHNLLADKSKFMAANSGGFNSFASVIVTVADSLHLPRQCLHLFYDEDSATIAFNSKGALFFNYRYFENLHLPAVQQGNEVDAIIYWFVVACHELAHNIVADHSSAHSYYTYVFCNPFTASNALCLGLTNRFPIVKASSRSTLRKWRPKSCSLMSKPKETHHLATPSEHKQKLETIFLDLDIGGYVPIWGCTKLAYKIFTIDDTSMPCIGHQGCSEIHGVGW